MSGDHFKQSLNGEMFICGNLFQSAALQKTALYYARCKDARSNYTAEIKDGAALKKVMNDFGTYTGLTFPMMQDNPPAQDLSPSTLGKAMGVLSRLGVDTLVSIMVDTDWKNPTNFKFFIDQNVLFNDKSYYATDGAWNTIKQGYTNYVKALFKNYAALMQVRTTSFWKFLN